MTESFTADENIYLTMKDMYILDELENMGLKYRQSIRCRIEKLENEAEKKLQSIIEK